MGRRKSSIFVILPVVGKFMERRPIYELISAGMLGNDPLCANGYFVGNDLQGRMSFSATVEPIQERRDSSVTNV